MPNEYSWSRIRWRTGFWLAFIPSILAFVVFFWPKITEQETPSGLRLLIGIPLVMAPILVPIFFWLIANIRTALNRIREFGNLWEISNDRADENELLKANFAKFVLEVTERQSHDLKGAKIQNSHVYISVTKGPKPKLTDDDQLWVIDITDLRLMGIFQVAQETASEYYAVSIGGIDPLWKGEIHQQGEVHMFPNMTAISISKGDSHVPTE